MRLNQDSPRNWHRISGDAKKLSLRMTFPLGVAGLLLVFVLSNAARAEGQSELASISSPETNGSLTSLSATSASATQTIEQPTQQAQPTGSLLFSVFRSERADTVLPPQSPGQKLSRGLLDSVAPSAFIFTATEAGISQAGKKYPAFGQGAAGYGRYYWHDLRIKRVRSCLSNPSCRLSFMTTTGTTALAGEVSFTALDMRLAGWW
jgi:hypothetical protein